MPRPARKAPPTSHSPRTAIVVVALTVLIGLAFSIAAFAWPGWIGESLFLSAFAFLTVAQVVIAVAHLKRERRLRAANDLLCPLCEYDLAALGPAGTCPECGTYFTHADLQRHWTTWRESNTPSGD